MIYRFVGNGVTYVGKLKTPLKVNGNLNSDFCSQIQNLAK